MMSGTHVVLFNEIAAGMTYRLYALPRLYASRDEAEASGGENTLLQSVFFAPDGLDVDFPLTWRPATMYDPADDTFVAISNIPFIVVTYENSTRLFVLPEFVPATKYERLGGTDDEGRSPLPLPEKMLFPEPGIDLPYMHKRNYADHVRITSGFDAAFMVWLGHADDWIVMSTQYSKLHPKTRAAASSCDPKSSTVVKLDHGSDDCRNHNRYHDASSPRRLGTADFSHARLCLSPMSGTAFHTTLLDRRVGLVHMWEWMVPPQPAMPDTDWNDDLIEQFYGFDSQGFGVPPATTHYNSVY
jgi:hypothetical protein